MILSPTPRAAADAPDRPADGDGASEAQAAVAAWLSSPGCPAFAVDGVDPPGDDADATPPAIVETHGARLFLGERVVCKLKRAVAYAYLDATSLETRRRLCERELELNRPQLPDLYLDVVAITRESDGTLAVDGAGETLEWVLRMRRFERRFELDRLAREGRLSETLAHRLGDSIARYHDTLPTDLGGDGHARVAEVIDELDGELRALTPELPLTGIERFGRAARRSLETHRALLDRRASTGFVRRCHGDLHLRNLLLHDGEPVPFDALEFDERLATTDVLYDLAFLVMDLGHRRLHEQQNIVLNDYLRRSPPENVEGLAAMPLFLALRAAVRAMTTVQGAAHDHAHEASRRREARRYLEAANRYLAPRAARLIALGGLSGSGKSTLAAALPTRVARAPGAILLGSDAERKAALGVARDERLDPSRYTPSASTDNYRLLRAKSVPALAAGFTVIVDATWLDADERAAIAALARERATPFVGLWLDAAPAILERRVAERRGDVSDATLAVLRTQLARAPAPETLAAGWHRIEAGGTPGDTLRRALAVLERTVSRRSSTETA